MKIIQRRTEAGEIKNGQQRKINKKIIKSINPNKSDSEKERKNNKLLMSEM